MSRAVPVLLVVLAACGNGSYYPSFQDGPGFDTGAECGQHGAPATLSVTVSPARATLTLLLVDPDTCAELPVADVAGGTTWTGDVESGTSWVVRGPDGTLVHAFTVPAGTPVWAETIS